MGHCQRLRIFFTFCSPSSRVGPPPKRPATYAQGRGDRPEKQSLQGEIEGGGHRTIGRRRRCRGINNPLEHLEKDFRQDQREDGHNEDEEGSIPMLERQEASGLMSMTVGARHYGGDFCGVIFVIGFFRFLLYFRFGSLELIKSNVFLKQIPSVSLPV